MPGLLQITVAIWAILANWVNQNFYCSPLWTLWYFWYLRLLSTGDRVTQNSWNMWDSLLFCPVPNRYSSKQLMLLGRAGRPGWLRAFQGIFGHLLPIELLLASMLAGIHLLKHLNVTWFFEIASVFMIEHKTQKTAVLRCLALLRHLRVRSNNIKYWWLCPEKSIQFLFKISSRSSI